MRSVPPGNTLVILNEVAQASLSFFLLPGNVFVELPRFLTDRLNLVSSVLRDTGYSLIPTDVNIRGSQPRLDMGPPQDPYSEIQVRQGRTS
jgi:hypothetical protein